jgi:hypothetical protein
MSSVDTKRVVSGTFGNDAGSADVDTKKVHVAIFGNDAAGFIRVRKRKLKGCRGTSSRSFDVVRAVRINGKPRHKFVLGLGSQKSGASGNDAARMLLRAIGRMKDHGLSESQRRSLLDELVRKGARRPTAAECEAWRRFGGGWSGEQVDELAAWLGAAP